METGNEEVSRRELLGMSTALAAAQILGITASPAALAAPAKKKMSGAAKLSKQQNILFIFTDQERFIRQWPHKFNLPGHEKLSRNGVTFTKHYVSATMCTSSRSVMLTGLQTADNKMFDNVDTPYIKSMSTKIPTIGHMLRKAGYYTAYRGKWHLGREFDGHEPDKSWGPRMEEYGFADFFSPGDGHAHTLGGYQVDELIGASAVSWLRQKGRPLSDEKKPWSLFVSLVNPHDIMYFNADAPGETSQDTGKLLMRAARAPENAAYRANWNCATPHGMKQAMNEPGRPSAHGEYLKAWGYALGNIPATEAHWQRFSNFYFNSIRLVDHQLSLILAELESLGLAQNTMIVFTADHGEMGGNHGLRGKGPFAYEESIHVPLKIIHPDVRGGQECAALTSHIDLAPTLLSLAGVSPNQIPELAGRSLPGKDFSSALGSPRGASANTIRERALFTYSGIATNDSEMIRIIAEAKAEGKDPKAVLKELGYRPNLKKRGSLRCVTDGRYKFSRYFAPTERNQPTSVDALYANNDVELYDLKTDPHEMKNLAAERAKHEPLIASMSATLESAIRDEIGKDDGREMPEFPGIDWTLDRVDL